jgi:putative transposase
MSYVTIIVHAVFGTKHRFPTLEIEKRNLLFTHILQQAVDHDIIIDCINGHDDHVHILFRLKATQKLADIMHQIKGESAHWANTEQVFSRSLVWAKGYFARSVDKDNIQFVRRYIKNQGKHQQNFKEIEEYLRWLTVSQESDLNNE